MECPSINAAGKTASTAQVVEEYSRLMRSATKSLVSAIQMLLQSGIHSASVYSAAQHEVSELAVTDKATAVTTAASSVRG